ncbi:PPR32 phosphatase, partial [Ciccaba nigrolineata]|nr:PPR32 phosphatase [Ciccaba nigrolineata]
MASACPFVCPRAEPRALVQDSPAAGLGAVSPSAKACADLMNFYAMTYAVAHGREGRYPCSGGDTGASFDVTVTTLLASRRSHCQDTATSTTAEHFKPFCLPDGRSLLPWHIQQSGSRYPHGSSLPFLCTGAVSPRHTRLPQGSPKASRKHSTRSCCTDVLQKTTISTKEQSGFTRATPRSDHVLPALPAQPM